MANKKDHAGNMIQKGMGKVNVVFLAFSISNYIKFKEDKQMELNVSRMKAALELLKFKAMLTMCENKSTCTLNENDVNEILVVAGLGVITPESFEKKELEVL